MPMKATISEMEEQSIKLVSNLITEIKSVIDHNTENTEPQSEVAHFARRRRFRWKIADNCQ